jgi:phosphoribosylaminoimidazole-succinocarboxamide synthase
MTSPRRALLTAQLDKTLDETDFPTLGEKYEGKVRDNYTKDGIRTIIVSDRLSAFDTVLTTIPCKGQVVNQLAQYWFEETRHIAPNHVVKVPDPNVTIARECVPVQAEFIMRGYLTGVTSTSIWVAYDKGARSFCGHALADGMKKNQKLPTPILTPSTKAPHGEHDVSVSREELLAMGKLDAKTFDRCADIATRLFAFGQERAASRGLILVDTKYEMGVTPEGEIVVIDEIHTPDSSRYWYADGYEARFGKDEEQKSLDKEYVRRWLSETHGYKGDGAPPTIPDEVRVEAAERYIASFELVTGKTFEPDTAAPLPRIAKNLGVRS